jgi:hypothetical protein
VDWLSQRPSRRSPSELDWLASRVDAEYFLKIRDAIITAADALKALDEPGRA